MPSKAAYIDERLRSRTVVTVKAARRGIEIRDKSDALMLAQWAYDDIEERHPDADLPRGTLHLACKYDSGKSLLIEDLELVRLVAVGLAARPPPRPGRRRLVLAFLGRLISALGRNWRVAAGFVAICPILVLLGLHLGARVRALGQTGACAAPAGLAALAGFQDRLSVAVTVSRRPEIDAIADGPDRILITQGLVGFLDSPEELAALLALERARGLLGLQSGQALSPDQRRESFRLGRSLLEKADIPAQSLGNLYLRMRAPGLSKGALSDLFDEPPLAAGIVPAIAPPPPGRPILDDSAWRAVKSICG